MFGLHYHFADLCSMLFLVFPSWWTFRLFRMLVVFRENIHAAFFMGGVLQIQDWRLKEQVKIKAFHRDSRLNNRLEKRMWLSLHDHLNMVVSCWSLLCGEERELCRKKDLDGSQGSSMASVGWGVAHLDRSFLRWRGCCSWRWCSGCLGSVPQFPQSSE